MESVTIFKLSLNLMEAKLMLMLKTERNALLAKHLDTDAI